MATNCPGLTSRLHTQKSSVTRAQSTSNRTDDALESSKHTNVRASRVAEVHVGKLDVAFAVLKLLAVGALSVNLGPRVDKVDDVGGGASGFTHIGNKVEDWVRGVVSTGEETRANESRTISGLDGTEDDSGRACQTLVDEEETLEATHEIMVMKNVLVVSSPSTRRRAPYLLQDLAQPPDETATPRTRRSTRSRRR